MGDEVIRSDPKTGKTVWTSRLAGDLAKEGGFLGTPPIAAGSALLVATLAGEVLRLDAKTGAVAARHKVGGPVRFAPVAEGGRLYVGTQDGRLVCIDTGDASIGGWTQWGANAQRTGR
jgi:outer membrane protein assembly factor BamB